MSTPPTLLRGMADLYLFMHDTFVCMRLTGQIKIYLNINDSDRGSKWDVRPVYTCFRHQSSHTQARESILFNLRCDRNSFSPEAKFGNDGDTFSVRSTWSWHLYYCKEYIIYGP